MSCWLVKFESQEVKVVGESDVRFHIILKCVVRNLVRIHAGRGNLDGTCKVHIVVTHVIGRGFNLVLGQV
jgi:hypothetical protein